ncbi:MAG: Nif11-like leader peptide family RiPP precursor [Atopobiaceae bacterium]|nr:Nif11-like leader peptide family RiPP precursor [Atopobiaceae bacterium]
MAKQAAREFLAACTADSKIEEAVNNLPEEERDSFEAIVRLAAGWGYEFTPEELAEAFAEKAKDVRASLEGQELSDEELEQVAGGGERAECSSDFNPKDSCYFDDRCTKTWNFYKRNSACSTTYDWLFDNCTFTDKCSSITNSYLAGQGEWIY